MIIDIGQKKEICRAVNPAVCKTLKRPLGSKNNGGVQSHLVACVGVGPRRRSRAGSGCCSPFSLVSSQRLAAMAWPRVQLVVTADDFGYCPRRDKGIVEAFLAGTVTSVSLLANGTAAESAAELARRHSIPTGLHANLTEGRPVGPARHTTSSLLNSEGFFLGKMGFRKALEAGDVALPQVREELEAQLNRFRELLGVCQVFAEALQAFGVRFTRLPVERGVGSCSWLEAPARAFACAVESDARAAMGPFSRHGLRWTDAFVGLSTCGRHMSAHRVLASLARALEDIPAGRPLTAELMAHPGYPSVPPAGGCGEGPDAFSCSWERLHELHVLTAPTLRARLAQNGVQLCAIDDLDSKRPGEGVPCEATLEPFLKPSPP
ncbi:carbohydrate deacetylase isoform X3 [Alexandromys fortis]|uniref:carbohydrate deacetylase isoform X3 n=1 Tax=Alexandromys fortis TaxID=100897 RepID=UPI002153A660|nr:carbohydrate deacetylase isoform X3 [Microtus fortis]